MRHFLSKAAIILLLIIISISSLWSGTTGKISGIIVDKETGEPLPGANIVIEDTEIGASTDLNGQYTILEVPPGEFKIQVSYIGYQTITFNKVQVQIDQTTRLNVEMKPESLEMEEIVVVAERDYLKPDVATSVFAVTDEEIDELPITSVVSALGLQAGIRGGWGGQLNGAAQPSFVQNYVRGKVSVQGGLNIRGGEGDNILFLQDGITLRDPRNNEPITQIPLSSVKEISVERGGFNAEYGQVRSGIVNVVSNEGDKQSYSGSFQIRGLPPQPKYNRVDGTLDLQDPYSFVLRPFFDPDVCWTGTGNGAWDEYTRKQYPTFEGWNKVSNRLNADNDPDNDLTPVAAQRVFEYEIRKKQPNDQWDYDIDAGFGGPVPFVSDKMGNLRFFSSYRSTREMLLFPLTRDDYRDYDLNFQLISNISKSMKLRLSGLFGKKYTIRHNWDSNGNYFYPRYPTDIAGVSSSISDTYDLVGLFSDYNFCLADISHQSFSGKFTHSLSSSSFYEVSLENFRRKYYVRPPALRDTSKLTEVVPGFYEDSNPFGYWPDLGERRGQGLIIDGGQHIAKARDNTVVSSTTFKVDYSNQIDFNNLIKTGLEFTYNDLNFDYGNIQSSGQKDEIYASHVQKRIFPVRGALYIQDKLEAKGFTFNAGLRLDYSNSNVEWYDVNAYNKDFYLDYDKNMDYKKKKSKAQWDLSPRLGIAHPISENAKLFFNYGHFLQLPQYESMFRIQQNDNGAITAIGNPNLILAKTVAYELGFDYIVSNNFVIQAAGFYNDITDQQDFTNYRSLAYGFSYYKSTSNNYEDTRGFELTLRKPSGRWWSGFTNLTYQVTTTGHFGSARQFDDISEQNEYDAQTVNLYQNRPIPQPYARLNLNFTTPYDFGPGYLDHILLGNWQANILFDWQEGYWTTWNPGNITSVAYNVQAKDFFNINLRFNKNINLGRFSVQLFADVYNLLNELRLWNTGDQDYMASLHLPKSDDYGNIIGDDKVGDYREPGVDWQPIEHVSQLPESGNERAWYYSDEDGKYHEWVDGAFSEVNKKRVNKMLDDKAYIDMPNASTYWFLDPRKIYWGIKISFNFNK